MYRLIKLRFSGDSLSLRGGAIPHFPARIPGKTGVLVRGVSAGPVEPVASDPGGCLGVYLATSPGIARAAELGPGPPAKQFPPRAWIPAETPVFRVCAMRCGWRPLIRTVDRDPRHSPLEQQQSEPIVLAVSHPAPNPSKPLGDEVVLGLGRSVGDSGHVVVEDSFSQIETVLANRVSSGTSASVVCW